MDDAAHTVVAAELTNNASDAAELRTMLRAVKDHQGALPEQAPADTGCQAEAVFEALADRGCELVMALGRERKQALRFGPQRSPHTAALAARQQADEGKAAHRRRKWIAEPPNGWIENVLGFLRFRMV